jgi:stage III sporulation protein AG
MAPQKPGWLNKLLEITNKKQMKKHSRNQYLVILLGVGIILMLTNGILTNKQGSSPVMKSENTAGVQAGDELALGGDKSSASATIIELEDHYEAQLKDLLEDVVGVGEVSVMVTLGSTSKKVYQKDIIRQTNKTDETDSQGGKRQQTDTSVDEKVVLIQTEDGQKPILVTTEVPEVIGVWVNVEGADNIQVQAWITEAITKVLDVPSHKVAVIPKKSKGD